MAGTCQIKPLKHLLWDEMETVFGKSNRTQTKFWYKIAHNEDFLRIAGDSIKLNEEGEPTFASLLEAAKSDKYELKILQVLQEEIGGEKEYDWNEAVTKIVQFNRDTNYKKFMVTAVPTSKGKVKLQIVKRNIDNQLKLVEDILNRSLQLRIIYFLKQHGVDVTFLENPEYNGRYSTFNALRTESGLMALVEIAQGRNVTQPLAEEAGHFAVGSLGNHPLIKRLEALMTDDVIRRIYDGHPEDYDLGAYPVREAMGHLVGKMMLEKEKETSSPIERLALRIKYFACVAFARISRKKALYVRLEAEKIATSIARSFLSEDFGGTVEDAMMKEETMHNSKHIPEVQRKYNEVRDRLQRLANLLSKNSTTKVMSKNIGSIIDEMELNKDWGDPLFVRDSALSGIVTALTELTTLIGDIRAKMQSEFEKDMLDDIAFQKHFPERSKQIGLYKDVVDAVVLITSSLRQALHDKALTDDAYNVNVLIFDRSSGTSKTVHRNIQDLLNSLDALLNGDGNYYLKFDDDGNVIESTQMNYGLVQDVQEKARMFFTKFLELSYGKDYIIVAKRVVFNGIKVRRIMSKRWRMDLIVDYQIEKSSWWNKWYGNAATCSDVVCLIAFKAFKAVQRRSLELTISVQDLLRALCIEMKNIGISDPSFFVERNEQGVPTGNFLNLYDMYRFDLDRAEFFARKRAEFEELYKDNLVARTGNTAPLWSSARVGIEFEAYIHADYILWKKDHMKWSVERKQLMPNESYLSKTYAEKILHINTAAADWKNLAIIQEYSPGLFTTELKFFNKLTAIKERLDAKLPDGSTSYYRMPLFRELIVNRFKNRMGYDINPLTAVRKVNSTIGETFRKEFSMDVTTGDYGSDLTFNSEEDRLVYNPAAALSEACDRIPLYGINMLNMMEGNTARRNLYRTKVQIENTESQIAYLESLPSLTINQTEELRGLKENLTKLKEKETEALEAYDKFIREGNPNVSTDLFHSILAYADMANNYSALDEIAGTLEVGRKVLLNRKIDGVEYIFKGSKNTGVKLKDVATTEAEYKDKKGEGTYAYLNYCSFIEKNIYGQSWMSDPNVKQHKILTALYNHLQSAVSASFLGAKLSVTLLNLVDGIVAITIHTFQGRGYGKRQLFKANCTFFFKLMLPALLKEAGFRLSSTKFKDDPLSLIMRQFNIDNKNVERFRTWDTRSPINKSATWNQYLYGGMRMGEIYMTAIPYIASMQTKKVITKEGHKDSLWNVYMKENKDSMSWFRHFFSNQMFGSTTRTMDLKNTYFSRPEDRRQYLALELAEEIIQNILDSNIALDDSLFRAKAGTILPVVEDALNIYEGSKGHSLGNKLVSLTVAAYLRTKRISYTDPTTGDIDVTRKGLITLVNNIHIAKRNLTWTSLEESSFLEKCCLDANYMHGIYDKDHKGDLNRHWYTAAWSAMKGYAFGMFANLWSGTRHDIFNEHMRVDETGMPMFYTEQFDPSTGEKVEGYTEEDLAELNEKIVKCVDVPSTNPSDPGYIDDPLEGLIYINREVIIEEGSTTPRATWVEYRYENGEFVQHPEITWDPWETGLFSGGINTAVKVLMTTFNKKFYLNFLALGLAAISPVTNTLWSNRVGGKVLSKLGFDQDAFMSLKKYVGFVYATVAMYVLLNLIKNWVGPDPDDDDAMKKLTFEEQVEIFEKNTKMTNPYELINLTKDVHITKSDREVIKKLRRDWAKGIAADYNAFQMLIDAGKVDPKALSKIQALANNFNNGINTTIKNRQIDFRGIAYYIAGRAYRDVYAYTDPTLGLFLMWKDSPARQEGITLSNLLQGTTIVAGLGLFGEAVSQTFGGLVYDDVNEQGTLFYDVMLEKLQYLKDVYKSKIKGTADTQDNIDMLGNIVIRINAHPEVKDVKGLTLYITSEQAEFLNKMHIRPDDLFELAASCTSDAGNTGKFVEWMIDKGYTKHQEWKDVMKQYFYQKNNTDKGIVVGDPKYKQSWKMIIPLWDMKNENLLYSPWAAYTGYLFALRAHS